MPEDLLEPKIDEIHALRRELLILRRRVKEQEMVLDHLTRLPRDYPSTALMPRGDDLRQPDSRKVVPSLTDASTANVVRLNATPETFSLAAGVRHAAAFIDSTWFGLNFVADVLRREADRLERG